MNESVNVYYNVVYFIDVNLIYCLIPMILTLRIIESLFINEFETRKLLSIIRWIIIIYTAITLIAFLLMTVFSGDNSVLLERITGPYGAMYLFMIFFAAVFPFSLLIRKLGTKLWFVLLVALLMKSGFYWERFVIILTSLHRDYLPPSYTRDSDSDSYFYAYGWLIWILQGFILVVLGLALLKLLTYFKKQQTT